MSQHHAPHGQPQQPGAWGQQPQQPPTYGTWQQQAPTAPAGWQQPAPQWQQPAPSGHRPAPKRHTAAWIIGGVIAGPLLIGGVLAVADDAPPSAAPRRAAPVPTYTVTKEDMAGRVGRADLLIPDATTAQAEAAIRDYATRIDGPQAVSIATVRARDARVIVCSGEWRLDDRAAQVYGGKAGLTVECPDPAGK
ncbi:hypothetical protein PV318_03240 [Streptomyces sp. ME02-6991-2B]|nr:hypothetical protein [Streptomyces sp. ME02-6991-2B]